MSVAEIKTNIINEISSLDDILKLEKITKILGIDMPKKDIYVFSDEQQKKNRFCIKTSRKWRMHL